MLICLVSTPCFRTIQNSYKGWRVGRVNVKKKIWNKHRPRNQQVSPIKPDSIGPLTSTAAKPRADKTGAEPNNRTEAVSDGMQNASKRVFLRKSKRDPAPVPDGVLAAIKRLSLKKRLSVPTADTQASPVSFRGGAGDPEQRVSENVCSQNPSLDSANHSQPSDGAPSIAENLSQFPVKKHHNAPKHFTFVL